MKRVTKAIICAAGQGTRFLPMTKAMPKEMLPVIDKPVIQYVVEGAVAAGITDIIIVGNANKRAIEDHFDHQPELEQALRAKGKSDIADRMHAVAELANFIYLRQKGLPGNATPVLNAAPLLDDEPYMILSGDDLFYGEIPQAVQLMETFERVQQPVISVIPVDPKRAPSYGIADISRPLDDHTFELSGILEKPAVADAPTYNGQVMANISGWIVTPRFMEYVRTQAPDQNGEVGLSYALSRMAKDQQVYGRLIDGDYLDCGNKAKYLEAIVKVALGDPELGASFKQFVTEQVSR